LTKSMASAILATGTTGRIGPNNSLYEYQLRRVV
jgi:hypothetical protein